MTKKLGFAKIEDYAELPTMKTGKTTYNAKDFKTATKLAKELGEKPELVSKTMEIMKKRKVYFVSNCHVVQAVNGKEIKRLKLHQLAMDIFNKFLSEQKAKL